MLYGARTCRYNAQGYPLFTHSPYTSWWLRGGDPTISDVWHIKQDKRAGMSAMVRVHNASYRLLGAQCTPGVQGFPGFVGTTVHPTRTVFHYHGLGLAINLTFATPAFLEDLNSFTPLTYVYFDVAASSMPVANVQFFLETPGQMATDNDAQTVAWSRDEWSASSAHLSMGIGVARPQPFKLTDYWIDPRQPAEHIDWGRVHLTIPHAKPASQLYNVSSWMGSSNLARSTFARSGTLPIGDDLAMPEPACGNVTSGWHVCTCGDFPRMRGGNDYPTETADNPIPGNLWPGLSVSFDLAAVQKHTRHERPRRATAIISYDDLGSSARFFGEVLPEVWRREGVTHATMLEGASDGAVAAIGACEKYDQELVRRCPLLPFVSFSCVSCDSIPQVSKLYAAGGEDFAVLAAAGYRSETGWVTYAWYNGTMDGGKTHTEAGPGPIAFVKGIGSSGDTGTIDDNYRSIWPYVWGNPDALTAMVRPLNLFNDHQTFDPMAGYHRNVSFPYNYSAHYLGQYPVMELQCWNKATQWEPTDMFYCEPMPLEATADNVQLSVFAAKALNSTESVRPFLRVLLRLTDYLVDNGLYPATQLTTDDFMGAHTNNTNLAVKSIIGIGAFAQLCDMLVKEGFAGTSPASAQGVNWSAKAVHYHKVSKDYAEKWRRGTAGGLLGGHVRSWGENETFSLKYNLVFDRILRTNLFDEVIQTECRVFRDLKAMYNLEYGLPFGGDVATLNASNSTGTFYQVDSWTAWFAPLCGQDLARPIYKAWRQCHETAWNRTTNTCTNACSFEAKAKPVPARCALDCGVGGSIWSLLALQQSSALHSD